MQSLTEGLYREDFFYGYPYDEVVPRLPPQFDYVGSVLTSSGVVVCTPGEFTLHYGSGEANPDAGMPYGGAVAGNPYYLRFPVLSWEDAAGLFLTVTTTDAAELSFDRSFSGYVGDRLIVTVNDTERMSISSAGHPWTRSSIALPKGTSTVAIVLVTAPYAASGVVREGVGQSTETVTELFRYLRLTNLSITNLAALPVAEHASIQMLADSSASLLASLEVTSGALLWAGEGSLLVPTKAPVPLRLDAESTLGLAAVSAGAEATLTLAAEVSLTLAPQIDAQVASDAGGFALGSTASLIAENTAPQDITELVRPLQRVSLRMRRPVVVDGRPTTLTAVSETEVVTAIGNAQVLGKINPYSPGNAFPTSVGSPTWRWLSLDAQSDPRTGELVAWHTKDYAGPTWSTPGAYRPVVDNFTIRKDGVATQLRYPAVHFDAAHLDHLNVTLAAESMAASGAMTWVFVGSFVRYRGELRDSCPIFDYAADAVIDYAPAAEPTAERGGFTSWLDAPTSPSLYLGLTNYGSADPTTSRLAWRSDDASAAFERTGSVVITDATPVVLVYVVNGANSFVRMTPLLPTGSGSALSARTPRPAASPTRRSFSLGKARAGVPFGGSFATGSMSLLEVAYLNRALTDAQVRELSSFYASLYAPASDDIPGEFAAGTGTVRTEQVVIYADNPATEMVLLTGDRAVKLGLFTKTPAGEAELYRLLGAGVPVLSVNNADYAAIVAYLEAE